MGYKEKKRIFVSYIDDDDNEVTGFFPKVEETNAGSLVIYSDSNKITIPPGRWKKVKEERWETEDNKQLKGGKM